MPLVVDWFWTATICATLTVIAFSFASVRYRVRISIVPMKRTRRIGITKANSTAAMLRRSCRKSAKTEGRNLHGSISVATAE